VSVKPFQNPSDLPEELHFITNYMQEMWEKGWISWKEGFYVATSELSEKSEIITDYWSGIKDLIQVNGQSLAEFNKATRNRWLCYPVNQKQLAKLRKIYTNEEIAETLSNYATSAMQYTKKLSEILEPAVFEQLKSQSSTSTDAYCEML